MKVEQASTLSAWKFRLVLLVLLALSGCTTAARRNLPRTSDEEVVVLDTSSYWRCHFTWMIPAVRTDEGLVGVDPVASRGAKPEIIKLGNYENDLRFATPFPPADWMRRDFDDSSWCRIPGPFFYDKSGFGGSRGGSSEYLGQLCLRGKFTVRDPRQARGMTLSIDYRGGIVVYLNGSELVRAHLPTGELTPETLADDYPREAFVKPDGKLLRHAFGEPSRYVELFHTRLRKLSDIDIPTSLLRRGTNVLAVAVHRTALNAVRAEKNPGWSEPWATAGVTHLQLKVPDARAVVPNVNRPGRLQVWNCNVLADVYDQDYGDAHDKLKPIKLVGARKGTYSGKVVVSSAAPLRGIQTSVSDLVQLQGGGRIPISEVQVRFGVLVSQPEKRAQYHYPQVANVLRFDGLLESPPQQVPVMARPLRRGASPRPVVFGAVQPIWVTVQVPNDAPAGDYRSKLTISTKDTEPVAIPIELEVIDWTLPDPGDFITHVGLYQSPESVALYYQVPRWSDEHFQLIAKSLEQLGRVGNKVVFVYLICRTHAGNEESLVRWIKEPDGSFSHDYSLMDRYLDLVEKHMGKPRVVIFKVWEIYGGGQYYGQASGKKERLGALVTVLDPITGRVEEMEGPKYGTAESLRFWKPVLLEIRERMKERGLLSAMMLGQGSDRDVDAATVGIFHTILPDMKWMTSKHGFASEVSSTTSKVPVGYIEWVWGAAWGRENIPDPDEQRLYGWNESFLKATFPRYVGGSSHPVAESSPLAVYRTFTESTLVAGKRGFGRVGADFWPVLESERGTKTIVNRYPISNPAQLSINCKALLHPGPEGALSTARYEMLIENVQACEAGIFIEKALLASRHALSPDLLERCEKVLDARTRYLRWIYVSSAASLLWYPHSGWQERTVQLYSLAGEVASRLSSPKSKALAAQ